MRTALDKGEKPKNEDFEKNKQFAEQKAKTHNFLKITKNYVRFAAGNYAVELFFKMSHELFKNSFNEKFENCQSYI